MEDADRCLEESNLTWSTRGQGSDLRVLWISDVGRRRKQLWQKS